MANLSDLVGLVLTVITRCITHKRQYTTTEVGLRLF